MVQTSAERLVLILTYRGRLGSKSEMADRVVHVRLLPYNAQPQGCFVYFGQIHRDNLVIIASSSSCFVHKTTESCALAR